MHSKPHYVGGGHDYQLIGYCEIDKYAANAYSQIHGVSENYNLVDVTKVNTVLMDDVDLITYGFPCQDISATGKQRGFEDKDGNRTRSGLFFEALRIIEETRPLYAIAENVKALTSKKFEKEFKTVLDSLDGAGYNNYWAVLNAKDYGIPQNRERVFIVSIRKDVDNGGFKFPEKMPLNIRVKDILENSVDEKYYINTEKARQLIKKLLDKNRITGVEVCDATVNVPNVRDISNAIISRYDAGISNQRSWGTAVIEPPVISTQQHAAVKNDGICTCLTEAMGAGGGQIPMITDNQQNDCGGYRIRKLTPLECFRLMGFSDEEFDKIKGISNTQLYKMAGNSIVVNVLEAIFK